MKWSAKQRSILTVVAITAFMGTFLISAINVALPAIEKEFQLKAIHLSWIISIFLLSTGIFLLPVGRIGDIIGIHKLFKSGLIIFIASSLLCGFSINGNMLIALRFLQGIGAALTTTTGPALLVTGFPPDQRGRVLGISVAAVYLGLAFGPFAGGFITDLLGWRYIFYFATILGAFSLVLAYRYLDKDIVSGSLKSISFWGSIFYVTGLICLVFGSSKLPAQSGWILMLSGIINLCIFWLAESKSTKPLIDTKLYTRNRLFAFSNLAALINYSATFAIVFLLSLYLQQIQNLSAAETGIILVAQPITMAIFSPISGSLSDKFQPRYLTSLGMLVCASGLLVFAFIDEHTSIQTIVLCLIWMGLGFAMFSSPNMNTIMGSVDKKLLGFASGSAATMRIVGQILSMTIASLFFAVIFGNEVLTEIPDHQFLKACKYAFLTFSIICFIGIYFSFQRGTFQRN